MNGVRTSSSAASTPRPIVLETPIRLARSKLAADEDVRTPFMFRLQSLGRPEARSSLRPNHINGWERLAFFPTVQDLLDDEALHGSPVIPFGVPAIESALQPKGSRFGEPGFAVLFAQF